MKVELRGTLRASLGVSSVDVDLATGGAPLSDVLASLARAQPRVARYLQDGGAGARLRVVHNGGVVLAGEDPVVRPDDSLWLLHAVAGG